jgi:hypothetical protein
MKPWTTAMLCQQQRIPDSTKSTECAGLVHKMPRREPMQIGNSQLEFREGSFPKLMIALAPHKIKAIPSAIA